MPTADLSSTMCLSGVSHRTLRDAHLEVPLRALTVLTGRSGAGKSTLLFDTLLPALQGRPGGSFTELQIPKDLDVRWVDAKPIGRTPRSTPATATGLMDLLRKRFASTPAAKAMGFTASRFAYNSAAGRCPECQGLGVHKISLHLLEDAERPCPRCAGRRYRPDTLQVHLHGLDIHQVLDLTAAQAAEVFQGDPPIARRCQALVTLGLGYLPLGRSSTTLSRGEAQRIKLATLLGRRLRGHSLILLDEPDRGLHPVDVARLVGALHALVQAGHTVLAISHHRALWRAAHRLLELQGGQVRPLSLPPRPPRPSPRTRPEPPTHIRLRGVRTHNLKDLDVDIPHGKITVITGVSGSGKSSLAFHTLAAASWSRYAESLPFQVRRYLRKRPAGVWRSATGLTPSLSLAQGQPRAGRRSTVATLTGLSSPLRLLWSRLGQLEGAPCGLPLSAFSPLHPLSACPDCQGLGVQARASAQRLITHPERPLDQGAMAGTRPGAHFGEADGQHMATLRQAAEAAGVDLSGPWRALSSEAKALAMRGTGGRVYQVRWSYRRGKRTGEHSFEGPWPGLLALVEAEAIKRSKSKRSASWAEPLEERACTTCHGDGLRAPARLVTVEGLRLPELLRCTVDQVDQRLKALQASPALEQVRPGLRERLQGLRDLGLGHLPLSQPTATLSEGELRRLRLAGLVHQGLTGLTLILDEPGAGLPHSQLQVVSAHLRRLCDQGHTVVLVSHRPALIQSADHELHLGPGAGPEGGELCYQGPPRRPSAPALPPLIPPPAAPSVVVAETLTLPGAGLVVITGPSGSGKSALLRALGGGHVEGLERFKEVVHVRGVSQRSPLSILGLMAPLQALYAPLSELPRRAFSYRSPAGRCPTCKGQGVERVSMDVLADLRLPCPACEGQRYRPEVLEVRWRGLNPHQWLMTPAQALLERVPSGALKGGLQAMVDWGLGHIEPGRAGAALSGGEAQRLHLAARWGTKHSPALYLLDEPASGLHEADLPRLVVALRGRAARGDLVLAVSHRRSLIAAADQRVHLPL